MGMIDLSLKMKRLTAWLYTQTQPDGLAGKRFHGGPDMDSAREWLDQAGFSRVRWSGYPTMCREGHAPVYAKPISISGRFDGRRPVAIAALCICEDIGYLMAAATAADRGRGAQQALIERHVAQAERQGCAMLVSETLHMLENSDRNLQRAGFEEVYDKEVYQWNCVNPSRRHA